MFFTASVIISFSIFKLSKTIYFAFKYSNGAEYALSCVLWSKIIGCPLVSKLCYLDFLMRIEKSALLKFDQGTYLMPQTSGLNLQNLCLCQLRRKTSLDGF